MDVKVERGESGGIEEAERSEVIRRFDSQRLPWHTTDWSHSDSSHRVILSFSLSIKITRQISHWKERRPVLREAADGGDDV